MKDLQAAKLTSIDLLQYIIEGQGAFEGYSNAFFSPRNRDALRGLLDSISNHEKGSPIFEDWVAPRAMEIVCDKIHVEMDAAKPYLKMGTKEVTPEFIAEWDIHKTMEPVAQNITPTLTAVLIAASETKESFSKPKTPRSRNRSTVSICSNVGCCRFI